MLVFLWQVDLNNFSIYMLLVDRTDCHWKRSDLCLLSTHMTDIIHNYNITKLLYKCGFYVKREVPDHLL